MEKVFGAALVLVGALLLAPSQAAACKTCDVPEFWDSNCAHSGCTYCVACTTCCGGDPNAGGNCDLYCGGAALMVSENSSETSLAQIFLKPDGGPSQASLILATPASPKCPSKP
jgi:hypothetical protein